MIIDFSRSIIINNCNLKGTKILSNNAPIGFFDSGLGGATVLKRAIEELPNEDFVFFADNGNAPYGNKSLEQIKQLSISCANFLTEKNAKAIVIACNTATSASIKDIREIFKIPVISMEPAIKPAVKWTENGKVLMMATKATCELERYIALKNKIDINNIVIDLPCIDLVETIEGNNSQAVEDVISRLMKPFKGENIKSIVLGCTHYSIVEKQIKKCAQAIFGSELKIFDGTNGTIKQLIKVLRENNLLSENNSQNIEIYTSAKDKPKTIEMIRNIIES